MSAPHGYEKQKALNPPQAPVALLASGDRLAFIRTILEAEAATCACFATAAAFLRALARQNFKLLITDSALPDMTGAELLARVKRRYQDLPVIIVTDNPEVHAAVHAMKLGANDYLRFPFEREQLLAALREALDLDCPARTPSLADLTPAEKRVTRLVVSGLTSRQIARELHRSVRTVETHRYRIFRKLDLQNQAQLTSFALQQGLLVNPESDPTPQIDLPLHPPPHSPSRNISTLRNSTA